jgi:hypothetical protein
MGPSRYSIAPPKEWNRKEDPVCDLNSILFFYIFFGGRYIDIYVYVYMYTP